MSQNIDFWGDYPDTWDKCVIGGMEVPGITAIVRCPEDSGLDVKKAPKSHYAVIVDQGYKPPSGEMRITLGFEGQAGRYSTGRGQWQQWQRLHEQIRPQKAQNRKAFSVSHPTLAMKGITKIYIDTIDGPFGEGPSNLRTFKITFIKFGRVVRASSGAGSGTVGFAKPRKDIALTSSFEASTDEKPSATETDSPTT